MLFNSLDFLVFLPIVFGLYWFAVARSLRAQNLFVLAASYVFYGWWDWRFLSLIAFSTVVDFTVGLALAGRRSRAARLALLWTSVLVNLGLLGFFKYFNFFLDGLADASSLFGHPVSLRGLELVLPVGISFYTFQTLSYTIDVYRGRLAPSRDFVAFAAFVSFFPQLVAGPIERAEHLLPQFGRRRSFGYAPAVLGLRQVLWGLFKKVVIADNCAVLVNAIFAGHAELNGSALALGAVLFSFQIYGDFSGYSDIAIGTARLFGFELKRNFAFPYFSRDIAEFWRRWHISLSTWFRDYLYIPLGGSRVGRWKQVRNVFVIFLVSGFWHGANWTFVAWGALHALCFMPLLLLGWNRSNLEIVAHDRRLPTPFDALRIAATFTVVTLAWVLFRAESLSHAVAYVGGVFSPSLFAAPALEAVNLYPRPVAVTCGLVAFMVACEWVGRRDPFALARIDARLPRFARWSFYAFVLFLMAMYMQTDETPFIYFQF